MSFRQSHESQGPPSESPLDLPRILCLHGGGSSGEIFRNQARALIKSLPNFRLVFVNAPFFSGPGPDIFPVYENYGPFRRWLRWRPDQPEISDQAAVKKIFTCIEKCKSEDPGRGPWVGLMGFSQGAKIAASILYDQQARIDRDGWADTDYRFAVLMNGRGPLLSFDELCDSPALMTASQISTDNFNYPGRSPQVLRIPTIHVHGLSDPGLYLHRQMMNQYHDPGRSTLVEWEGAHRVPIKKSAVEKVTTELYRVAREQGICV